MGSKASIGERSSKSASVAGIVLAAGEGKRLGGNKALLEIGGITSLERVATCMLGAGCDPVVIVGGAEAERVREAASRLGVQFALNTNWRTGQFSSLKTGVSAVLSERKTAVVVPGAVVALVDHPLVKKETYQVLAGTFRRFPGRIVIPTHQDRRGHPVVLPLGLMTEILDSPDGMNLRDVIRKRENLVLEQAVDDIAILKDIDTAMDLDRLNQW